MEFEPKEPPAEEVEATQHMKRLQGTAEEQPPEQLPHRPEVIPPVLETQSESPADNSLPDNGAVASPESQPFQGNTPPASSPEQTNQINGGETDSAILEQWDTRMKQVDAMAEKKAWDYVQSDAGKRYNDNSLERFHHERDKAIREIRKGFIRANWEKAQIVAKRDPDGEVAKYIKEEERLRAEREIKSAEYEADQEQQRVRKAALLQKDRQEKIEARSKELPGEKDIVPTESPVSTSEAVATPESQTEATADIALPDNGSVASSEANVSAGNAKESLPDGANDQASFEPDEFVPRPTESNSQLQLEGGPDEFMPRPEAAVSSSEPESGLDEFVPRPESDASPEADQPFDIKNYPQWEKQWETWPAELRDCFAPMIETGNLTPEIYQAIKVSFKSEAKDVPMDVHYAKLGLKGKNVAAEAVYRTRTILTYPELKRFSPEMQAHIINHEIGHFLGAHFITPEDYKSIVKNRPQSSMSKYMRKIGENAPEEQAFEMLADDIADFLQSSSPEQMLSRRLSRAGNQPDLSTLSEEERSAVIASHEAMLAESTELYDFLKVMLSKERQENPATALPESQQSKWLKTVGIEEDELDFDYDQEVPYDVAELVWQPPKKPKPAQPEQKQGMHLFDLLYAKG